VYVALVATVFPAASVPVTETGEPLYLGEGVEATITWSLRR
jgi:hypothetical protein